jgi:hypothetical protein
MTNQTPEKQSIENFCKNISIFFFLSLLLDLFVTFTVFKYNPSFFTGSEMNIFMKALLTQGFAIHSVIGIFIILIQLAVCIFSENIFKLKDTPNYHLGLIIAYTIFGTMHLFGALSWLII